MEQTACKTYFSIIGDFDPNEITKILKMKNTGGHSIGEKKIYGTRVFEWASWEYGTEYIETLSADEQAELVISPLISKVNELLFIKEKYKCQFILMQVPKIESGDTPALGFDKMVIDFCSETGTEIQIDLYVNPYNSELK
jgi:hypothetical protein